MPEIWLNYGLTDVVLDIKEENLGERIGSAGRVMDDAAVSGRLAGSLDLSAPMDIVVLHDSASVRKVISALFALCEQRSAPFPRILADRGILGRVRAGLPEGGTASEFGGMGGGERGGGKGAPQDANLVFVAEMEFDGLFGYETVSTRLIRRFGGQAMLRAYARRDGNLPAPGRRPESLAEAKGFTDGFEIRAIEIVACSEGIVDLAVGHPSETLSAARVLESGAARDVGQERHRAMIVSTGKEASGDGLGRALASLWNCAGAVRDGGLAVLVAECRRGLGSDAVQQYVEGRLAPERLHNPTRYVGGMEDLLFLSGIRKRFQTGLVSVLPEFYVGRLGMIPLPGIKRSMDYILKTQGPRQKVSIVSDGARTLLR